MDLLGVNGQQDSSEMEQMKQEILREMRKEIGKMKVEVIEGELEKVV